MKPHDITVNIADGKFNYRVGAIILDAGRILMARNSDSPFFYTVGGRVRFGETAEEAVLRESYEETNIHFEIDRLAYIHENFFTFAGDGMSYHEISMFFLMKPNLLVRDINLAANFEEEYGDVFLHWLPIDELAEIPLYPEFFKSELSNPSAELCRFVTRNDVTTRV